MSASSSSANVPSEIIDACTCSVMLVGDSSDFGQLRSISFQIAATMRFLHANRQSHAHCIKGCGAPHLQHLPLLDDGAINTHKDTHQQLTRNTNMGLSIAPTTRLFQDTTTVQLFPMIGNLVLCHNSPRTTTFDIFPTNKTTAPSSTYTNLPHVAARPRFHASLLVHKMCGGNRLHLTPQPRCA